MAETTPDLQDSSPERRLVCLGIALPAAPPNPIGHFRNVRRSGNLLYVSGQGPVEGDGRTHTGKVGREVSAEVARDHARLVGLNILAALKAHCGSLDQVTGVVKLLGLVNASPDFTRHPFVIDGASQLFTEVFGESGVHARSAFGVSSLPNGITVEVEAIFEHVS
jgi:enamine deaminase RidA (YjgF/YER057c/UK114 family)